PIGLQPGLEMFHRSSRQYEDVPPQDIIDIGTLSREQIDQRQVPRCENNIALGRSTIDYQGRPDSELLQPRGEELGLGLVQFQLSDDQELAVVGLARRGPAQTKRPPLFRQVRRGVARGRAMGNAAATEDVRPPRAVPRPAGTLLLVDLGAGAGDFGTR